MARKIDRELSDKVTHVLFSRRDAKQLHSSPVGHDAQFLSDLASALGTAAMTKLRGVGVCSKAEAGRLLADDIPLSKDLLGKVWDAVAASLVKLGQTAFSDRISRRIGKSVVVRRPLKKVKTYEGSIRQRLDRLRRNTIKDTVKRCFRYGASGGGTINVTFGGEPSYRVVKEKNWNVYKGAFKGWAATSDDHFVTVPTDWLSTVRNRGLAVVGGMMTLSATPVSDTDGVEVYKAVWARQGRGYEVVTVPGYIARSGKAVAHGGTPEEAIAKIVKKRRVA